MELENHWDRDRCSDFDSICIPDGLQASGTQQETDETTYPAVLKWHAQVLDRLAPLLFSAGFVFNGFLL